MDTEQELLTTLAELKRENDRLRADATRAEQLLHGLESLLAIETDGDPLAGVFAALRSAFEFSQVMVLSETEEGGMLCVAAEPAALAGTHWPAGPLFGKVADGLVTALCSHDGISDWETIDGLPLSLEQPALYLPLTVRQRRGLLALLRAPGAGSFGHDDIALARKFSALASHALAALTDRQLIDETKNRATAAEDANRTKSLFMAHISHELRTPLNAIIGFAEFIEQEPLGPIGDPAYGEYVGDIRHSGQRLLTVVNDLLLLTRLESGQHELAIEAVDLADEAALVCSMLDGEARERQVVLEIGDNALDAPVAADQLALRKILTNVIDNAIKFSPAGGRVSIDLAAVNGRQAVIVRDRGVGISTEVLRQLGNPFAQADGTFVRQHQGMGLGLAICFRLAQTMQATLSFDSAVGQGTAVTLSLPSAAEQTATPSSSGPH